MSRELTDWFAPGIKPERVGVYQREYKYSVLYAYWDGVKWYSAAWSPMAARREKVPSALYRPWRGLAEQPK